MTQWHFSRNWGKKQFYFKIWINCSVGELTFTKPWVCSYDLATLFAIQTQLIRVFMHPSLIMRKHLCSDRKIFLSFPHPLPNNIARVYTKAGMLLMATSDERSSFWPKFQRERGFWKINTILRKQGLESSQVKPLLSSSRSHFTAFLQCKFLTSIPRIQEKHLPVRKTCCITLI